MNSRTIALTGILAVLSVLTVGIMSDMPIVFADQGTSSSSSNAGGNPSQSAEPETSAGKNPNPTPQRN